MPGANGRILYALVVCKPKLKGVERFGGAEQTTVYIFRVLFKKSNKGK